MASAAASRPGARVHVELSQRLRRTTKQPFAADALRFTGTKQLWNDSTAPWPERLFEHQYAVEMNTSSDMSKLGYRSTAWVKRLPAVVSALNNEVTRLTGKKPAQAIKEKTVSSKPATPYICGQWGCTKRNSRHKHMYDTCTTLANWNGEGGVRLIQSGHLRSTTFIKLSQNRMRQWCTTCTTGPKEGLFVRS